MQIKVLFDKYTENKSLHTGWGVSFLIDGKILFDTGENGAWLTGNMRTLGVDISKIETAVISHDHWDHRGGLWRVLKENPKLNVLACPNFSRRFKNRVKSYGCQLIEIDKFTQVYKNIYSTGEIEGKYDGKYMPEQALVLRTKKGMSILTGCAHPGIIKIIENVKKNIPDNIYLVLGGFHLTGKHKKTIKPIVDRFKQLGIKKTSPSHCTGKNAREIFKEEYNNNFIEVRVGQTIEI